MATYAANLAEVQVLQTCGTGFIAFVPDPGVDIIVLKDPTPDHMCGTNLVFKQFHGADTETAGHAAVDMSADDSIA